MNLKEINTPTRNAEESFSFNDKAIDIKLGSFWQWVLSDLIENRNRGILAEFIVKEALEINQEIRLEWDAYDLITKEGIKIEVKSAAYFQAWKQNNISTIIFGIAPTKSLLDDNNYTPESIRHADVYIFCLLDITDENQEIDPMKLEQWTFYLVKTTTLNEKLKGQKTVSLSTLKTLNHLKSDYSKLKENFESLLNMDMF